MTITQSGMDEWSRTLFIPVILVLDAWTFQYILNIYYSRRREFRVRMLLLASFLSFAVQVYFHEDRKMIKEMNDISETCLELTFIVQITIIGRAVNRKMKVRSIVWFTHGAEFLIVLGWLEVIGTILEIANVFSSDVLSLFGNILESTSLIFVLIFRFYYLSLSSSFRQVREQRKFELVLYSLLVVHEIPFMIFENYTSVSWEFVQGIFNRVLVVACLVQNVRHKAQKNSSTVTSKKGDSRRLSFSSDRASASNALGLQMVLAKLPFKRSSSAHKTYKGAKIAVSSGSMRLNAG